jgi:hypothetical protein
LSVGKGEAGAAVPHREDGSRLSLSLSLSVHTSSRSRSNLTEPAAMAMMAVASGAESLPCRRQALTAQT